MKSTLITNKQPETAFGDHNYFDIKIVNIQILNSTYRISFKMYTI